MGTVPLALADLTRETTLLFAVAAAWGVARGELGEQPGRGRGAALLAGAIAPYLVLKAALAVWLGSVGSGSQTEFSVVPFGGFLADWPPGVRSPSGSAPATGCYRRSSNADAPWGCSSDVE